MSVSINTCFAALTGVALLLATAGQSQAEWSFTWLGRLGGDYLSCAYAVSADGSTVVGESIEGGYHWDYQPEAFRWTQSEGMVGLDFLPGHGWSEAHDVSADGSVIVGYSQEEIGEDLTYGGEAFRWTEAGGMRGLADPLEHDYSWAYGVSADGSVVVGYSRRVGEFDRTAFRWTEAEGMIDLGYPADPPGGEYSRAYAVSADGSTVVGYWGGHAPLGSQQPFRWTEAGGMIDLGGSGVAYDVSADGSVVVGERYIASGTEAFRWTEEGDVVGLGHLPASDPYSIAQAVSDDGSLVVGSSHFRAFLWDDAHGIRDLNELLTGGGLDLQGGTLTSAQDISFDGQTIVIVGEGHGPDGSWEAWMAVIPEPSSLAALASVAAVGVLAYVWRRRHGRSKMKRPMFGVAVLGVLACAGYVQAASFTPLVFPRAEPSGVSNSAVVVGFTSEPRAFRWTRANGMTLLPGGETDSHAWDVSADGSVVVGDRTLEPLGREAFRWTESEGMVALETEADYADAHAVSADGSAVVGDVLYGAGLRGNQACLWTEAAGLLHLGYVGNDYYSHAWDVSADGSVVVGDSIDPGAHAFRWTQETGMVVLPGGIQVGRAVSTDGSVVVGEGYLGSSYHAFRWTQETGSVDLGQLAGEPFERDYFPQDVSGDGSVVVGEGYLGSSSVAFIWDPDHGMLRLQDALTVDYGLDLGGMNLTRATAISDNGLHIVGLGEYTNGVHAAWIATIPEPSSPVLAIVGLLGLLAYVWRRRESAKNAVPSAKQICVRNMWQGLRVNQGPGSCRRKPT